LFNATASGYVTNFAPLLMLALLFGLSTDYEVFLISRVQEHYEESGNNEESVAVGLQATGPLITGAALLMIAVFSGFAFSSMLPIQTIGFGMAVAILLDATIVRLVIVPAAMKLMGRWNWWLPVVKQRSSAIGYQQSQETSP
jgi:RND superfamily putative drug exporter